MFDSRPAGKPTAVRAVGDAQDSQRRLPDPLSATSNLPASAVDRFPNDH